MTYVVVTLYLNAVKRFKFVLLAAVLLLITIAVHASASNVVSDVVTTLSTANAVSAPFNPYAPLIEGLLHMLSPLAMFLCGVFSHKSGVSTGKESK